MSEPVSPPPLPVTWRPRRGRVVAYGFAAVIVLGAVVMAVFIAQPFKLPDRVAIVAFGCAVAWVLHLLGRVRVEADDEGLTIVNAVRTQRVTWPEVLGVTMVVGDPWPRLDLSDGRTVGAMGIQGSEKARARRATAELRALIRERGEAREA
ncbi:PH domain-containing protein [Nonomuraea gerenzanensis]|uniref:Putative membrane protein n=1 Tax=Nonomuraea gerenzanensis TaxID=93944 RepID=A0A1M4E6W4_9ACTN|nr:PH domain-containing protein [Nonomuraea gerenzanensis]UBU16881.1 PH domain-containing protein [Nonomuraea gerenzanensis]SBO94597.1 putative membrane protein [Nonomuraea gerenzanensis]